MTRVIIRGKNYEGRVAFAGEGYPDTLQINLKKEDNNTFYTSFYSRNLLQKTRKYQSSVILKKMKPFLFSSPSILEVGCGEGIFIDELVKTHQGRVLGIDSHLKKESKDKIKCDLYEFKGEKFDCIILLDVFEHFEDHHSALKKIKSLLKEDGYLILKVPNKNALFYKLAKIASVFYTAPLGRLYQIDFPPQHFFYYNKKSLKNVCQNGGFKYLRHFYMSEVPVRGLYTRLWGLSPFIKVIAIPLVLIYNLVSLGSLRDSIVIGFRKEAENTKGCFEK